MTTMGFYKRLIFLLLLIPAFILGGCKKTKTCNGIPNVGIYFSVDLNQPQYSPLQVTGGSMEVTGGDAGVVIYRYQSNQFMAYDCMCPYDGASNSKAVVAIQTNKLLVKCPIFSSVFVLSDGSVSSGPSTCPLKPYKTSYDGVSTVTISN